MTELPNILWLVSHDTSPDLGCYAGSWPGAEYACTPRLDRLAAEGARYENAFAVAPVCAPSRSAAITGMYPPAIGTMHMRSRAVPPPEVRCFPEYLRAAGWWCTNDGGADFQFATPVTVWDENGPGAHWRNRPGGAPFFGVVNSSAAHESQIYADEEQFARTTAALTPEQRHDPALAPLPPYYPDTPPLREAWARYGDCVTAVDHWAGRILDELEADGLADSTLVVFWSDHGRGMPRAKRSPYEAGLHVPLLVRWPGRVAAGTVRRELVSLLDLAPTMLAAAGLDVPAHLHGRSLFDGAPRSVVHGHADRMTQAADTIRTVRDARFRYLRNYRPDRPYLQHQDYCEGFSTWRELRRLQYKETVLRELGAVPDALTPAQRLFLAPGKPAEELYDLERDPHEVENLAADPAYAGELERLRGELDAWQAEHGDLGLLDEAELAERWRPGGVEPVAEPPRVELAGGTATASCATPGASIAWTSDPPRPGLPQAPSPEEAAAALVGEVEADEALLHAAIALWCGVPPDDGRRWRLYTGPVELAPGSTIWFRACRLGHRDSEDVRVEL
ncbi:MAG TPA: sulfatase [Gaiellaceae bacterium]|nr:sulfatase [Gaiellaceae bacterium]